jgi:hypothetical protein
MKHDEHDMLKIELLPDLSNCVETIAESGPDN